MYYLSKLLTIPIVIALLVSCGKDKPKLKQTKLASLNRALLEGAGTGDAKAVQEALSEGANVNARILNDNEEYETALTLAVKEGHIDVIKFLLADDDIDVNLPGHQLTALIIAIVEKNKEAVELLMVHKDIDINYENDKGLTALDFAIKEDYQEAVTMLKKAQEASSQVK